MDVIQALNGVFHHFELARELESRGYLKRIYSTFPWKRLKREGVPQELVRTFPWLHPPLLLLERHYRLPKRISRDLHFASFELFDAWISRRIEDCDALVALSGSGLKTGAAVQGRGGKYICDRGSSHIRYQNAIVSEEYARWGFAIEACDPRMIEREESEYAMADAITVPSEFSRRTFIEMGVPAKKLHKIPYGVRLERFRRTSEPPRDSFEVLFAGTVSLRKGVPYLLEAFRLLNHPKKRLRIAGPVLPEMKVLLGRQDLTGIEVLGRIPQERLAQCMGTSHVMVLPSIEEGLALVQGQALACGCPLISSYNTGGADIFTDGVEGFLVPIRSAAAIASRLQELAADEAMQERMSEAALRRVTSIGGWRDYGAQYAEFLKKLTQPPRL